MKINTEKFMTSCLFARLASAIWKSSICTQKVTEIFFCTQPPPQKKICGVIDMLLMYVYIHTQQFLHRSDLQLIV